MKNLSNNRQKKYLYKFLPFNQLSLQIIINKQLWLGSPDFLNDPFEGDFIINNFKDFQNEENSKLLKDTFIHGPYKNLIKGQIYNNLIENESLFLDYLYEYLNISTGNSFGTTSFSEKCNSLNMWAHYADSHKGFVIIFDKLKLADNVKKLESQPLFYNPKKKIERDIRLVKVEYGILTSVDLIQNDGILKIIDDRNILTKKLKCWKYEKEVRIIEIYIYDTNNQRFMKLEENCISGIIFGQRMSLNNKQTIKNLVPKNERKIIFYQANKNPIRDGILFDRINN